MALDQFKSSMIRLDRASQYAIDSQFAKQGDANGRLLYVQLTNGGVVEAQLDVSLNMKWKNLSSGNEGYDNFTVSDASTGLFQFFYPTEMTNSPGKVICDIEVLYGATIVNTRSFVVQVEGAAANGNAPASSNSFTALQDALIKVNNLEANYAPQLLEVNEKLAETAKHQTAWINIKQPPYNAKTNGVDDDSLVLQKAIDDISEGGTIYLPNQFSPYLLKTPVIKDGKSFTLKIEGTLKDGCTNFVKNFSDTGLTGKGLLAFGHGSVKLLGNNKVTLDGNRGVATSKTFIHLFECTDVEIAGVNGIKFTEMGIVGVGCLNVTHRNGQYDSGDYAIMWSRTDNLLLDNITSNNAFNNGIVVHNRGIFANSVYTEKRPRNVKVVNCTAFNVYRINVYAVGITVDSCDDFQVSGNYVDGNNKSTMAYSFADSKGGQIFGNRIKNVSTISNGTEEYTGIGMEFDRCADIQSFGNTFDNVLIGHVIAASENCEFSGIYRSTLNGESSAGQSSMFMLSNSVTKSKDITLSGTVTGGSRAVTGDPNIQGLVIDKLTIRNPSSRAIGLYGGTVSDFSINDLLVIFDGPGQQGIILTAGVVQDLTINKFKIKAASVQAGKQAIYGATTGGKFFIRQGYIENYDVGIVANAAVNSQIVLNDIDFVNVATREQLNATNVARSNIRNNGAVA